MAPPTVTNLVPGTTGRNQRPPPGRGFVSSNSSIALSVTPASQTSSPLPSSKLMKWSSRRVSISVALSLRQESPYERPRPKGRIGPLGANGRASFLDRPWNEPRVIEPVGTAPGQHLLYHASSNDSPTTIPSK